MAYIKDIHVWVQKILPLVYDDSLSYYELLSRIVNKMNELIVSNNNFDKTIIKAIEEEIRKAIEDGSLDQAILQMLGNIDQKLDDYYTNTENILDTFKRHMLNNSLRGKKILFIGDSFTRGVNNVVDGVDTGFPVYFKNATGCDATIIGLSRAGFIARTPYDPYPDMTFEGALTKFANSLTTEEKEEYEYLICCGGINDSMTALNNAGKTLADLNTACLNFFDKCRAFFPNAKLYYAPLHSAATMTSNNFNPYMWCVRSALLRGVATTTELLYALVNRTDWVSSDGLHPNATGYWVIGTSLASWVCGGEGKMVVTNGVTPATGTTNLYREPICIRDGHIAYLNMSLGVGNVTAGASGTVIATIDGMCRPSSEIYVPAYVWYVRPNESGRSAHNGWLILRPDGSVKIASLETGDATLNNCQVYTTASWMIGI